MNTELLLGLAFVVSLAAGGVAGYFLFRQKGLKSIEEYENKAREQVSKSAVEAEKILHELTGRIEKMKNHMKEDEELSRSSFKRIENLIISKEEHLKRKQKRLEEVKAAISYEDALSKEYHSKIRQLEKDFTHKLATKVGEDIAGIKEELLNENQKDLVNMQEERIHKYEEYLNEAKISIAKNIITMAIQRYSSPTSVEKKSDVITVQRDEFKARVIGRNGEIVKALEELTGVDLIFNDAPNTIIISCHDLVKRFITRETINKLLKEKVTTPDKVALKLKEAEMETEKHLIRLGYEVIDKLNLRSRNLPPEFAKIIGRLQFRTSYGQNILMHSLEVGNFTLMLGAEIGANLEISKIGGFFHDLGKAIDHEVGGSHDVLSKEILEKYGFSEEEVHAAWTHHDAIAQRTAEALLVKAGDALSAGRPGARQETMEKYIQRIRELESISSSYEGVAKSYAISAGREVRVIVEPGRLKDGDMPYLAKNIAAEVQEKVSYPGKIKINVIRKTTSTDYANKIPGPTKNNKNK